MVEQLTVLGIGGAGGDDHLLPGGSTAISVEARNRVPMTTPLAPRDRAAARPRPSAMPPAATTGTSPAASTTWGTSDHRADEAAVPAGFAALGDQHVGAAVEGPAGLVDVHHLLHPQAAGLVRPLDELAGIAHVVGDHRRTGGEGGLERVGVEGPRLMVDGERPIGQVAQLGPLPLQIGERPGRRAKTAQPAGTADGRGELDLATGRTGH